VYQGVRQIPVIVNVLKKYEGEYQMMMNEAFAKPLAVSTLEKFWNCKDFMVQ